MFALAGRTSHEQMRHGGQIYYKILVVDRFTYGDGQIEWAVLKFI